jgi:uncharacterized protein (DUF1684 family)
MKQRIAIIGLILGMFFLGSLQAQVVSIPNKSEKHFAKKYPGATNLNWSNNVAEYTCKFKFNGREYKAFYHMDGNWNYTIMYMQESELPEAVKTSLANSRISDWKPKSCVAVENNKGKRSFRVEREKGIEEMFIFYDKNGKEVKSTYKL